MNEPTNWLGHWANKKVNEKEIELSRLKDIQRGQVDGDCDPDAKRYVQEKIDALEDFLYGDSDD